MKIICCNDNSVKNSLFLFITKSQKKEKLLNKIFTIIIVALIGMIIISCMPMKTESKAFANILLFVVVTWRVVPVVRRLLGQKQNTPSNLKEF